MTGTKDNMSDILLAWLRGDSGEAEGERVLLFTYGDKGYLGAYDGNQFVRRFHAENGRIHESPLGGCGSEEEKDFAQECGYTIKQLLQSGTIHSREGPRQYSGAAVFYALA